MGDARHRLAAALAGVESGLSSAHAQQLVTVAKRRDELPVTFAAFDAGELSLDQVVPIATQSTQVG